MTDSPHFSEADKAFMQEALSLAARGRFTTHPNPNVGCLIVKDNQVIGRGWHAEAGTPHAEVHALREAGALAADSTVYVTLEPCSHFGRTPPCADALIKAGVARVVVAMQDPYFQVSGRGIKRLREHGITVDCGLFESAARRLNAGFIKRAEQGLPYVRLKMAASLDGRTALANGESKWITSAEARADVQLQRAASSAILSGAGTVLADDPMLTVREDQLPQGAYPKDMAIRAPVRVLVDNHNQLGPELKLWQHSGPVWLARTKEDSQPLPEQGQQLLVKSTAEQRVDLKDLMQTLASRDINDIWCETGSRLGGALLEAGLVDELIVYMAPKLLGPDARGLFDLPLLTAMSDVPEFEFESIERIGPDIKIVARLTP